MAPWLNFDMTRCDDELVLMEAIVQVTSLFGTLLTRRWRGSQTGVTAKLLAGLLAKLQAGFSLFSPVAYSSSPKVLNNTSALPAKFQIMPQDEATLLGTGGLVSRPLGV